MAVIEYHKAGNSQAQQDRALAYLFAQSAPGSATQGVLAGLVVWQTTTASGSIVVGPGAAIAQETTWVGSGLLVNEMDEPLPILTGAGSTPMGGLPRNDIVWVDRATLKVGYTAGTPNAVPTDPTIPATAVALARLRHAASATTVPSSAIDDLRSFTTLFESTTGWIDLPRASGVSGTLQYRKRGSSIDIRGALTGSFAAGFNAVSAAGVIPAAARPAMTPARGSVYVGSAVASGTVEVTTAGTVNVQVDSARTVAQFSFTYGAG